ncbi:DNA-binding response regulator [Paenibacillus nanensis]|uniref:DNA-binding response regulator n=1 Tax=Paenibacillus nanensis TaxID=393251 RepID=A0A3A1VI50_9BACL|nr:response regulator transcription factor [Paenibacillus nanensis]RIX60618.1 DNA-binding response regulator [Paenibacillus nanensis]
MQAKIMIIEDEKAISDAIAYALKREGYEVEVINRGDTAAKRLSVTRPDAVILDVMLPGMDGYDVLKQLQDKGGIGVIMLTAKEDIVNKVLGLELGADDYLTKPFDMRELLARLKSLLRRIKAAGMKKEPNEIQLGGVRVHVARRTVMAGERKLELTPKEFELMALLAANPEIVYERDQLLDLVWGMDYYGGTRTVDIHVQRLRKKLGPGYGDVIQTVHGIGYRASGGHGEN